MTREQLDHLRAIVEEQAEDEGLWFIMPSATEHYLQRALRRLHAEIEAIAQAQGVGRG